MSINSDPDRWKTLFDEIYLRTDARSVDNEEITRKEVDVICELLPLRPGDRILDLCGGPGRHSLALCSRGFDECTVVDYSRPLLERGKEAAARRNYTIVFIQADARNTGLKASSFNHVLIMGNSLGYLSEPSADREILTEACRLLRPRGAIIVDVTDGRAVRTGFIPNAWHEIGDEIVVCRQRELREDSIRTRELVLSKRSGMVRDCSYLIRLFELEFLTTLIKEAGFWRVKVRTGFSPHSQSGDFGFMKRRLIVTGRRG